uniref:Uncharacterized protein n=1 Tax=Rhizophora mucronata TaxID=61149 RepID=A0A2P2Q1D4_RHIMU
MFSVLISARTIPLLKLFHFHLAKFVLPVTTALTSSL